MPIRVNIRHICICYIARVTWWRRLVSSWAVLQAAVTGFFPPFLLLPTFWLLFKVWPH